MATTFYTAAAIAIVATALAISRKQAVHALLYLIVSLLAVALIFFVLGAPFVAALEVIIYAGAIMVLFVFVLMLLNLGAPSIEQARRWLAPRTWIGPLVLTALLLGELLYALASGGPATTGPLVDPRQVGLALFGRYAIGVELASMLLLAGLIGAYHLGRRQPGRG
ncbi:MAG: NADH-quinone oxidoreductase subunit J [Acidobacteriota bacterium]